jgi:hypothetical protein
MAYLVADFILFYKFGSKYIGIHQLSGRETVSFDVHRLRTLETDCALLGRAVL